MAAPALSIDRVEIMYSSHGVILISPNDQEMFLLKLKENCSQILVKPPI